MSHTHRRRRTRDDWQRVRIERGRPGAKPAPQPRSTGRDTPAELVSDHAVLRYLERVVGVDVGAQVRALLLADGRAELIRTVVRGKIRIPDTGAVLQIADGRVVTVKLERRGDG